MQLMPLDRAAAEGIAFSHLTLLVSRAISVLVLFNQSFDAAIKGLGYSPMNPSSI